MNNPLKLFMSYRSTDSAKVDTIVSRLAGIREKGKENEPLYAPWQDKYGILGGQDWWQAIVDAIAASDVFVFHLSREALKSDVCKAELSYAYARNRFILPIVLEGEYTYNTVTGKNDISYWNDVPTELKDTRIQFIFYQGSSFYADFEKAIAAYKSNPGPWKDLPSPRPPDPRQGTEAVTDVNTLYTQACDYADHLNFETAIAMFRKLINLNDSDFSSDAYEWIELLGKYKKMMEMDAHPSTRNKLPRLWDEYKGMFPKPFLEGLYKDDIFDPKEFASRDFKQPPPSGPAVVTEVTAPAPVVPPPTTPAPVVSKPLTTEKEAFDATIELLNNIPAMMITHSRQTLVMRALVGCRVLNQIQWEGGAGTFNVHLVMTLRKFGQCSKDMPAIVMLLEGLKNEVGDEQHPAVDRLIAYYSVTKT